jgi:hypothetical protein
MDGWRWHTFLPVRSATAQALELGGRRQYLKNLRDLRARSSPYLEGCAYSSSSSLLESISLMVFRLRRRSQLFQVFRRLSFTEMYSWFRSFCFGI